jgi:hypothetical protein
MQAIVDAAPEAPVLDTAKIPTTSRRTSPILVMAGAFALVLAVGAVTSLFIFGNDRGTVPSGGVGDGIATSTSIALAVPSVYGPLPANWDAVAIIDADALAQDRAGIVRAVGQAGRSFGVESVVVVSPEDVATALGWDDGLGGGIFIVTSGDAEAAEQAALQAQDGWNEGIVRIVLSSRSAQDLAEQAIRRLSAYSEPITEQLSLGTYSGPEPAFDTAELGDEMPLENAYDGADELPLVLDVVGGLSDSIVYVGSIDGINGFVYGVDTDGGTTEICQTAVWAMADAVVSACFDGTEPGLSKSVGMADNADDGIVVAVTALGDDVSVVAVEFPGGHRYWQRPVAGSAMFVTTDPGALVSITITTYNAAGDLLATDEFNPNS